MVTKHSFFQNKLLEPCASKVARTVLRGGKLAKAYLSQLWVRFPLPAKQFNIYAVFLSFFFFMGLDTNRRVALMLGKADL